MGFEKSAAAESEPGHALRAAESGFLQEFGKRTRSLTGAFVLLSAFACGPLEKPPEQAATEPQGQGLEHAEYPEGPEFAWAHKIKDSELRMEVLRIKNAESAKELLETRADKLLSKFYFPVPKILRAGETYFHWDREELGKFRAKAEDLQALLEQFKAQYDPAGYESSEEDLRIMLAQIDIQATPQYQRNRAIRELIDLAADLATKSPSK